MNFTSTNNCPCNELKKFQCILRNTEDDMYDHYLLLTNEQIRMVNYLLTKDVINSDIFVLVVLDEGGKTFEKV